MIAALQRLRRRLRTVLAFAATGQHWNDKCALALAGLARHRPFGDDSPYARLGRMLTPEMAPRVTAAGGQRISIDLGRLAEPMIFEEIFIDRTYPIEKVPFVPDVVIDCGAFCGMFSLLARSRFPTARFIAFEPEPHNFLRLSRNLALNPAGIEAIPAAVGTTDGTVRFSGEGFGGHISTGGEDNSIAVRLVSLAKLLRELQPQHLVLKLDVEGAEREILPDILPLLPAQTVIFLETHHEEAECQRYLQPCLAAGFTHQLVRNRLAENEPTLFLERMLVRHHVEVRHFCTYFDSDYTAMGLALYQSLRKHCAAFELWVLCLDAGCHAMLTRLALPGIHPILLEDFERGDAALLVAKANRTSVEYYFTCTPSLPLYLLRLHPEISQITYLDSDLYFYDNPDLVFAAIGQKSIAIIPHRFSPDIADMEENGIYNVGWLSFRRDATALACLEWWRARCLEWCHLRQEPGRYADQKYLDAWPARYPDVAVLQLKGANLAMWNVSRHHLRLRDGRILVDDEPLVFFHFHGLRRPQPWLFNLSTGYYRVRSTHALMWGIFVPYIREIAAMERAHAARCLPGGPAMQYVAEKLSPPQKLRLTASILVNFLRRNSVVLIARRVLALP